MFNYSSRTCPCKPVTVDFILIVIQDNFETVFVTLHTIDCSIFIIDYQSRRREQCYIVGGARWWRWGTVMIVGSRVPASYCHTDAEGQIRHLPCVCCHHHLHSTIIATLNKRRRCNKQKKRNRCKRSDNRKFNAQM